MVKTPGKPKRRNVIEVSKSKKRTNEIIAKEKAAFGDGYEKYGGRTREKSLKSDLGRRKNR